MPKILIGVPVSDMIPGLFLGFFGSVVSFFHEQGWTVSISISDKVPLDNAREDILRSALGSPHKYDYLLWIDADTFLDHAGAWRLVQYLEAHPEAAVASGLYHKKKFPYDPTAFDFKEGKFEPVHPTGNQPIAIDAVGFGCLVMRLKDIREKAGKPQGDPYFFFTPDGPGEDVNFCMHLRKNGLNIVLLPFVQAPHHGSVVTSELYRTIRKVSPNGGSGVF